MRNENKKKLPKYGKLYYRHSSHISGNKRRPGRRSYFDGWLRMARNVLGITRDRGVTDHAKRLGRE